MTSYIPENPIETTLNTTTMVRFTWKTGLFSEKSRLETCVDILAFMANPTQFKRMSNCKAMYSSMLMENNYALEFLADLGLIEQNENEPETSNYSVTQRGKAVLKYFKYFDTLKKDQKSRALKRQ